jgi:hypothetical protein
LSTATHFATVALGLAILALSATARRFGLTIPESVVLRATEIVR